MIFTEALELAKDKDFIHNVVTKDTYFCINSNIYKVTYCFTRTGIDNTRYLFTKTDTIPDNTSYWIVIPRN